MWIPYVVFILHSNFLLVCQQIAIWQSMTFLSGWLETTNSRGAFRLQGSEKMLEGVPESCTSWRLSYARFR